MKKLFLYVAILGFVFWSAYVISEYFFKADTQKANFDINYTDDGKSNGVDTGDVFVSRKNKNITYDSMNGKNNDDSNIENSETDTTTYFAGIRNGYVVVYENTTDNVFEYTDIDAELIRLMNPDLFRKLESNVILKTKEDVYKFLESISS